MQIPQCPTIRPSLQEFSDFYEFIHFLDRTYKKDYGMVKVVPPEGWKANAADIQERLEKLQIKNPIEQNVQGTNGYFQSKNIVQKKMTFRSYKKYAERSSKDIIKKSIEEKQNLFWKTIMYTSPIYGADLTGTLMDETSGAWNLNNLDSVLRYAVPQDVKGVTKPYCYIGTWKAFFSWHKEDLDLSAINYIHEGEPKIWYSIAPTDSYLLEQTAKNHYRAQYQQCKEFLRHKTFLINPLTLLKKYPELKISKAVHNAGEMMLVFGGAYHEGFNCGFNIAEAVNYATLDWLSQLLTTKSCTCSKKNVKTYIESVLYNLEESVKYEELLETDEFMDLRMYVQEQQEAQLQRENQVKSESLDKSGTQKAQMIEQLEEKENHANNSTQSSSQSKYRFKKFVKTDKTSIRIHFNALDEAKRIQPPQLQFPPQQIANHPQ